MIEDFSLDKEFDEEIDLTPLIDVVFILLIFFFLTSTFIRPSLPVELTSAVSASASADRKERLVITIDETGKTFYENALLTSKEISALLQAHPGLGINLFVDRIAPFEAFLSVIDKARVLGHEDLVITTQPEQCE